MDPVVIVGLARTPIGGFLGDLRAISAPNLGAAAVRSALERARLPGDAVDEVLMGNVLAAGVGQAPARQAAILAGLPQSVPCTTVSKVCGSGMKAVMLGHDIIAAGSGGIVVAGGMESMLNAPYLLPRMRAGARLGHAEALDHMFVDGLEDAYSRNADGSRCLMGAFAEDCADQFGFTRADQDAYALTSLERARRATAEGAFESEIVPQGDVATDEQPGKARPEKIPALKPAFRKDGTVTAANASSISDGAAALVLMRLSEAERRGLTPLAAIRGLSGHARAPAQFTTAPIGAVETLMARLGWTVADVDLFEINEAFAVVVLAAMRGLSLPHERVNVHGGACALGHPIGASGARILVTLIAALHRHGLRRGIATLCIGGGEATAVAVERLS